MCRNKRVPARVTYMYAMYGHAVRNSVMHRHVVPRQVTRGHVVHILVVHRLVKRDAYARYA